MVNSNMGLIYMRTNRLQEAEAAFLREIKINPAYEHAYFNLGINYFKMGKASEAVALWERTIEINPYYVDAYRNLIQFYGTNQMREDQRRVQQRAAKYGIQ